MPQRWTYADVAAILSGVVFVSMGGRSAHLCRPGSTFFKLEDLN